MFNESNNLIFSPFLLKLFLKPLKMSQKRENKTEQKNVKKLETGREQFILRPREEKPSGSELYLRAAGFHINLSC